MQTATKPKLKQKWHKLLCEIPDYDPFEDAGDCWFDEEAAQRALDFFPTYLKHIKGKKWAGKPFKLERWEQAIVANIFGWKRPDGTRRYRKALIYVPKKNGKTPLAAGFVIFGLLCDDEPGAEIYSAAADREQAKLVHAWVTGMVQAEPELARRCKIYRNAVLTVMPDTDIETGSVYKPISSEASTKHGYNSHIVVVDELHAQPNRELVDAVRTSTAARTQPLMIYITTSDYHRESICNEIYDYACKVRDGIVPDSAFLPVIYEASIDDDWKSPRIWRKANPNYDVSVSADFLKEECNVAIESPAYENTFKRLHLNIQTEQNVRWLDMAKWDACGGKFDAEFLKGKLCFAGLDMSSTTDPTALVLVFEMEDKFYVLPYFWIPKDVARKREESDKVPYRLWAKQGYIRLTEGNVIDHDIVRRDINELGEIYNIKEIATDRWNAAQIITQLTGDGFEVVPFGQGFASMSAPTKELEKIILQGGLAHGGHPVLRWMASNVAVEIDAAGNIKPSKKKSTQRIDGIVSAIMAVGRLIVQPTKTGSIYETQPLKML